MKYLSFIIGIIFVIMLSGCAKTVTPIFPTGKYVTFDINFNGNIDTTQNRYFIIMNKNVAPQIPYIPTEFVEPFDIPSQTTVDYYGSYYSSWKGYIVLQDNQLFFCNGPFTTEASATKESLGIWSGVEPKKLVLTFDLTRMINFIESDRLHFDIVSVDRQSKIIKDNLAPSKDAISPFYVFLISDTIISGSDEAASATPESYDILDWRVLIQ